MGPIRKAQIIQATRRVILRKGYHRATIQDIATEAGVSTGIPHHYFSSREGLLLATLEHVAEEMRRFVDAEIEAAPTPRAKIEAYIRGSSPANPLIRDGWTVWLEYWAAAIREPKLADFHARRYAWWREKLIGIIRDGIDDGSFKPVAVKDMVHRLIGMVDGISIQASLRDPLLPADDFERLVLDFVRDNLYTSPTPSLTIESA